MNFCWHQGHFYIHDDQGLTRWKLAATEGHCLVATGGTVGSIGRVAISAQGDVYLLHSRNDGSRPKAELRVYDSDETLEQDQPKTVVNTDDLDTDDRGFGIYDCSCSPDGVLYVLCNESSGEVKRLSGSNLVPVPVNFPPKFIPDAIVACRGEVLYIAGHTDGEDADWPDWEELPESLILRVEPGQREPVVVGQLELLSVFGLFVTDTDKIYMFTSDLKIWTFNPGDTHPVGVLNLDNRLKPQALLVHEEALYVLDYTGKVLEFAFPPPIELD